MWKLTCQFQRIQNLYIIIKPSENYRINTKIVIIEYMTGLEIPETLGAFTLVKTKKFGNTSLSYFSIE